MKCYHDMVGGFKDCPEDSCLVGYTHFGAQCTLSEVHWLPKQIEAVTEEMRALVFKKLEYEERLKAVLGE